VERPSDTCAFGLGLNDRAAGVRGVELERPSDTCASGLGLNDRAAGVRGAKREAKGRGVLTLNGN